MSRFLATRTFLTAVIIALLLPGLVQAKRFKRYPADQAEALAAEAAQPPQRAPEPGDYTGPISIYTCSQVLVGFVIF